MQLLHIDCSPRLESYSRQLSAAMVAKFAAAHEDLRIVRRDLGLEPIPHAAPAYARLLSAPGQLTATEAGDASQLSERLIGEIENADAIVIGTPMNNFTLPSVFKTWIDQVLRMGRTIGENASGEKIGLLADKPVHVGIAAGGVFYGEHARQPDFLTPYLQAAFGCIGLHSVRFLPLQATVFRSAQELAADIEQLVAGLELPVLA